MTLVNRWYQIIEPLVAQHEVDIDTLKTALNISNQTLMKSIDQLNDLLDDDIRIIQKQNKLQMQVFDYTRLETVLSGSLRKQSDFNSSSKRVAYLIKKLINCKNSLTIDELAEEVGVSRGTLNKDLKVVKRIAQDYSVSVVGKPNHGIEINGDEHNLRLLYIHQVFNYFDGNTLKYETIVFLDKLYKDLKLPHKIQELLSKTLAITIARVSKGNYVDYPIIYYSHEVQMTSFIEELVYHIELTYQISLSFFERQFIAFPLNIQYIDGLEYESIKDEKLYDIYLQMISRVNETLLVNFEKDQLYQELETHFKFLINRLIFHIQANDIFHGEIKNKYPLAFEMANVATEVLSEIFGYSVQPSEKSYLALYFEMMMRDKEAQTEIGSKKIAVVCTTGRGTANMICRRLMSVLGRDIEIEQFSEEQFCPEQNDHYFAIFTTIPLKFGQLKSPVVQITNLFDDQWLQNEWQKLQFYHQKNLVSTALHFVRLSPKENYQDYLLEMTNYLSEKKLVDEGFEQRIISREKQQSTIFGNRIAFPHTINQIDTKTILLLGLLEKVHQEDDNQVEFIFMVAIPNRVESQIEADLIELYDDIFRVASNDELKEAIRKVIDEEDFIELTKEKGIF